MTIIQPTDVTRAIVAAELEKLAARTAEAMRSAVLHNINQQVAANHKGAA